ARDRVDDIEGAGAIGHDRDAQAAVIACRGIRREADRRLVAQGEIRQDAAFLDHLEQRQHEVTGNAESLARAMIPKRRKQDVSKAGHGMSSRSATDGPCYTRPAPK